MREMIDIVLLIALGIGYIVLYFAKREEKLFQIIGYFLGIMIIALSTFYIIINFMIETGPRPRMQKCYKNISGAVIVPPAMGMPRK